MVQDNGSDVHKWLIKIPISGPGGEPLRNYLSGRACVEGVKYDGGTIEATTRPMSRKEADGFAAQVTPSLPYELHAIT